MASNLFPTKWFAKNENSKQYYQRQRQNGQKHEQQQKQQDSVKQSELLSSSKQKWRQSGNVEGGKRKTLQQNKILFEKSDQTHFAKQKQEDRNSITEK